MSITGFVLMLSGILSVNTGMPILVQMNEVEWFTLPSTMTYGQAYEQPIYEMPSAQGTIPTSALEPAEIDFYVNKLIIPQVMASAFIPIRNDINTYSGRFGPYSFDPRQQIAVKLCSFPTTNAQMINCETVPLNYANNYVYFARGYAEDEYIARQALKNFGALYFIISPEQGTIAQSNTAIIKLLEYD